MKSKNMEDAKKYFDENHQQLLRLLLTENSGIIEYQKEENQVVVRFDGFALCYQNSSMSGGGKGKAHYNNPGANEGLDELREMLEKRQEFAPLVASAEYHKYEYLNELIYLFCKSYADKNDIVSYFK